MHPHLLNARYYFIFSYFTRGPNFINMMKMEWTDIDDKRITYNRSKPGRTFVVKIVPSVQEILDYFKSFTLNSQ